jgi:peptidoglycan/xylan/chitin deacetylase (PgdA/CDA1 family)
MLKVCLSHDVDRINKSYQIFTHALKALKRGSVKVFFYHLLSAFKYRTVYWNFPEILAIEKSFGVRSTFFFLNESYPFKPFKPSTWKLSLGRYRITNPRIKRIISTLVEGGWEVGVHGSYASHLNPNLLKTEKEQLEAICKNPVIGIRQHYLNLNEKTWENQRNAGFLYDSSWGYTNDIGFKDNRVKPFTPLGNNFVVFPLVVMDSCFMEHQNPWSKLDELTQICIDNNAYMVINWHSNNYSEADYPGYMDAYVKLLEYFKSKNAKFLTLEQAYKTQINN